MFYTEPVDLPSHLCLTLEGYITQLLTPDMIIMVYRDRLKGLYVVARNFFLLLLNCSAWPCLAVAVAKSALLLADPCTCKCITEHLEWLHLVSNVSWIWPARVIHNTQRATLSRAELSALALSAWFTFHVEPPTFQNQMPHLLCVFKVESCLLNDSLGHCLAVYNSKSHWQEYDSQFVR